MPNQGGNPVQIIRTEDLEFEFQILFVTKVVMPGDADRGLNQLDCLWSRCSFSACLNASRFRSVRMSSGIEFQIVQCFAAKWLVSWAGLLFLNCLWGLGTYWWRWRE